MKTALVSAAMVAAFAMSTGTPANAQRRLNPQLVNRIDSVRQRYDAAVYSRAGNPLMGALAAGAVDTTELQLPANSQYTAYALCIGCTDLNIQVFAPNGTKLGEDVAPNATPVVEFTTSAMARYKILVTMVACGQPQCDFGIQLLRRR